jgi:SAM-dependent methyltransferase
MAIDPVAHAGFSAGAEAYEHARPAYPVEAVRWLVDRLRIVPSSRVVDLGAGTGKLTALLTPPARSMIAVEPVEGMRVLLRRAVPSARIIGGAAEAIPLMDGCADAVVAAQAFHWFDGPRALREIRRVLGPHGRLGLVWNARDRSHSWVDELSGIVDAYGNAIRRHETEEWMDAFATPNGFSALERAEFPNPQEVDEEHVVRRVASTSFIATLAQPERDRVLERVRDLIRSHPETRDRESFVFPHRTRVYACEKLSSR